MLTALIPVLRPVDPQSGFFVDNFAAFRPCVQKIYKAVQPRLEALDIGMDGGYCCAMHSASLQF